jgi:hypothetical protein
MAHRIYILVLFILISFGSFCQTEKNARRPDYLTFQTGVMYDSYNSLGIRTFFEYQKDLPKIGSTAFRMSTQLILAMVFPISPINYPPI